MELLREKLRAIDVAAKRHGLLMTAHADEEARAEAFSLTAIHEAISNGEIVEDYPADRRGPCCLVYAKLSGGRDLHVVVTSEKVPPRIITVYEPKPPYWATPRERGPRK